MENTEQFKYLYDRYVTGQATPDEMDELFRYIANEKNNEQLQQMLDDTWDQLHVAPGSFDIRPVTFPEQNEAPVRTIFAWKRIAIAASVMLIIGLSVIYLVIPKRSVKPSTIVSAAPTDVQAPQTTKATITLADGRIVALDNAVNGTLAMQGNVKLIKLANGQITYETARGGVIKKLQYNTLFNPRGSKVIDMTLADGSHVWLNAGSSVTYPIAFIDNERKISITGEAYFEVTHDNTKPFYVAKGDVQVQVLGTHFNVNAYDDESDIKVTLLEGSVKVNNNTDNKIISPGEQASVSGNYPLEVGGVDVEQVMAWKNGRFQFGEKMEFESIMRQIARWYDVKVEYREKVSVHFGGSMSRDVNVSTVLEKLELTGSVHFTVEGRKIIVSK